MRLRPAWRDQKRSIVLAIAVFCYAAAVFAQNPTIDQIVNPVTQDTTLAPGSLAQILGSDLVCLALTSCSSSITNSRDLGPFRPVAPRFNHGPASIASLFAGADAGTSATTAPTSVIVNGQSAPILTSTANSLSIQLPYGLAPGSATVEVSWAGMTSAPFAFQLQALAPTIYLSSDPNVGLFITADGSSAISTSNPAKTGQEIYLEAIGLGATNPPVQAGSGAPSSPLAAVTAAVQVLIDSQPIDPTAAYLAPSLTGVYDVKFVVPSNLSSGLHTVSLRMVAQNNTFNSNTVKLPVLAVATSAAVQVTGITPNTAVAGSPAFTLTVSGTNFASGAVIEWNGTPLTTIFISATQLTASVPASLIASPGNASIAVSNPGGSVSNTVMFIINVNPSCVPTALLLQPISPQSGFSVPLGQPLAIEIEAVDNCKTLVSGAVQVSFSNGDPQIQLAGIGQGNYVGNWIPANGSQSQVAMTVTGFETVGPGQILRTQIAISGTIQSASPQNLATSIASLNFSLTQGGNAVSQPLTIVNKGNGTGGFTLVVSSSGWLSVDQLSGSVPASSPATVTVTADPTGLAPGTYSGTITVQGGTQVLPPVTVTVTVSPAQPILLLSQTAQSFTGAEGGGAPLPQDFGILNIGQGTMDWIATASSAGGWLSLSSTNGTITRPFLDVASVNVSVDPTNLAAGVYYGQIQVTSPEFSNLLQTISVVLTMLPRGSSPGPEVRPSGLIFAGPVSPNPVAQTVMISNPGATPVEFNTAPITLPGTATWFANTPGSSTIVPGQPAQLSVQPNFSTLSTGATRGAITLLFADGTLRTIALLAVVPPPASAGGSSEHDAGGCTPTQLNIQPSGSQQTLTASVGQPVTLDVRVIDSCGNALTNATSSSAVTVAYSNLDRPGAMVHVGNGRWTTTWQPQKPVPAGTPAVATVSAFQALSSGKLLASQVDIPVTFGAPSAVPIVNSGAVLNAASFAAASPVAPGSLVTIFGANLANGSSGQTSPLLPLPVQLGPTQVMLGGLSLPLLYASDGQINAQVPFDLPVNIPSQLVVQAGGALSVPEPVLVAPAQPAIFTKGQSGQGQGVIVNGSTNVLADANAPVTAGDTVVIYCTGLGDVSPEVPLGSVATGPTPTVMPVTVTIGGQAASVSYSGLTPGFPGLYQVNATVPSGVAAGNQVTVVLTTQGQTSPSVTMAVR